VELEHENRIVVKGCSPSPVAAPADPILVRVLLTHTDADERRAVVETEIKVRWIADSAGERVVKEEVIVQGDHGIPWPHYRPEKVVRVDAASPCLPKQFPRLGQAMPIRAVVMADL
jgi:hypothetical protein